MRLEIGQFPIKEISFGSKTAYDNGVLRIDKSEVLPELLTDHRILEADLDDRDYELLKGLGYIE